MNNLSPNQNMHNSLAQLENLNPDADKPTQLSAPIPDFVTVLTVAGRGNKLVKRDKAGMVKKQAGPPISEATAVTVRVENAKAMVRLQRDIGENATKVLSLGFVPGTEPVEGEEAGTPFKFVSKKIMGEALGVDPQTADGLKEVLGWHEIDGEQCICRLKANMAPSTWCLFDIDAVRGMPDRLAKMNSDDRLDALAEIIPGFAEAGGVIVPSTTGRVLVDDVPLDATGEHFYVQLVDAADLERFGSVLLQRSLLRGYGFMRPRYSKSEPDKIVSSVPWGIADPTTFSHERVVYDGLPMVQGKGLSVAKAKIEELEGGRLDTCKLLDLTEDEAKTYAEQTGHRLYNERRTESVMGADGQIIKREVIRFGAIDDCHLKMDTQIETEAGVITLEEYWKGDQGHVRCQTPFRESSSWNGFLNRHKDGTPFVYDNGTRLRYVLAPDVVREHRAEIYMTQLQALTPDEIKKCWTNGLRWMEAHEREKIRQRVHKLTGVGLKELLAELNSAQTRWDSDKRKAATATLKTEIEASDRTAIELGGIDTDDIVRRVEGVLFGDQLGAPVLSHGSRLVAIRMSKPTTVREVRREHDAALDEVPLAMIVDPYQYHELKARVCKSIAFIVVNDGEWVEVPPPNEVIRAMLEHSHKRAPALVGIIEHPVMGQNGELLVENGLSDDGLYVRISKDLVPTLADQITHEMAGESLRWIVDVVLADFPFATEADVAGAVAALLTAIQRRMFDSNEGCPGFLTTAPIQSSGKTAFFQLLFALVWGRTAAATNWSSSDEELGKHILAILLEGHGGVLFDNLEEGGRIESNVLSRAMTSPKFTGRLLGENQQATVPTNCLWCFTGNNISASGDFNTRILPISIDPGVENPDQRSFSRPDLAEWCERHRKEFYEHALTILVGYQRHRRAGGEAPTTKPTRYTKWDQQVRHAMLWAGSADPAVLFEQNKTEDPEREGYRQFLAVWFEEYGNNPMPLSKVLGDISVPGSNSELKDAVYDLLPDGKLTSQRLGSTIRKFNGRWIDGFRISAVPVGERSHRSKSWYVERQP